MSDAVGLSLSLSRSIPSCRSVGDANFPSPGTRDREGGALQNVLGQQFGAK